MRIRMFARLVIALCAIGAVALSANAQGSKSKTKTTKAAAQQTAEPPLRGNNTKEGASQATKSTDVLNEIMGTPDKGIPSDLLAKANCVAVFPNVVKAGFIIGGHGGRGVASCRTSSGWSAPAYFEIKGGSVGLQAGAQSTDFVLLFMNEKGMRSLLSSKFELGGEASIAAGPVGRTSSASTDAKMNAEILSYSRSKGLFGGLSLKGSTVVPDKSDMEGTYGKGITAQIVLNASKSRAPSEVQIFPDALARYSGGTAN